jgi:CheY-like chemotaxis protein
VARYKRGEFVPATPTTRGDTSSAGPPGTPPDLRGHTILVVEDHEDSADMLRQIVSSFGARVLVAANGLAARQIMEKEVPDLVFCDLVMPKMDGYHLMEWLRGQPQLARVPVIALTALGMPVDIMRTFEAGFSGHLVKPVDYQTIAAQLTRILWAHPPLAD